ncbi:MAG: prephenate dehydrogenase/arogenate dehydrogenase family protein [Fimbriimonadaceae bacterium]|nr:prephenate dehydrogenase/arogenate dehydrogenase family protein [Fimbriimonadaceae bacterium]
MTTGTVGVVGLGLIGGSVAAGLKRAGHPVWGFDTDDAAMREALRRGYLDQVVPRPSDLGACDVVVVAVPPTKTIEALARLEGAPTILTDCTSVKVPVTDWVRASVVDGVRTRFVGGHPMAGLENGGIAHARPDLFEGAPWILTPLETTDPRAVDAVAALVQSLGAHPVTMSPETHDAHVALLSHLPHVLAALLVTEARTLDDSSVGGGSWRDLTRVGGAEPELWTQILELNAREVLLRLDRALDRLLDFRNALGRNDFEAIRRWFVEAREAKESARCD